jgi:hypothetical protein
MNPKIPEVCARVSCASQSLLKLTAIGSIPLHRRQSSIGYDNQQESQLEGIEMLKNFMKR